LDGRRICSQPERNEIRSVLLVTFSLSFFLFLSFVLFEARDTGLGNRYTRLVCFSRPSYFLQVPVASSFPRFHFRRTVASHRVASPLFSRLLFANGILFRKNTRESFESVVVQPLLLDFPSSLFRVPPRLRSPRLRLKGPLLRAVIRYLLYMLFLFWSPSLSLCSAHADIRGLAYGYHSPR